MNHFHVAAGILRDADGRILITERLCDGPFDGLWEFPGGKIGDDETALEALARELAEELGIEITSFGIAENPGSHMEVVHWLDRIRRACRGTA